MTKVASDLLTTEEITAMVGACTRSSERAIIMMLYEGGFRIGEIGGMKWGDLTFDKWGVIANVNFKTGKPRYVRLIMSREALAKWKNDYPAKPVTNEMPVFITEHQTHSLTGPWPCSSSGLGSGPGSRSISPRISAAIPVSHTSSKRTYRRA